MSRLGRKYSKLLQFPEKRFVFLLNAFGTLDLKLPQDGDLDLRHVANT